MASKRAAAIQMESAINRLVQNVEKFGSTVEVPRSLTNPADVSTLIDSISDALEEYLLVEPGKKTAAKRSK